VEGLDFPLSNSSVNFCGVWSSNCLSLKVSVICGNIRIVWFLKLMNSLDFMFQRNSRTCALLPFCVVLGN